ncbi:MAG: hypothetical protein ACKN9V_04850, partial [Pseudomonadota bacterium]
MNKWYVSGSAFILFFTTFYQGFAETKALRSGLIGELCYENGKLTGPRPFRTGVCAGLMYIGGALARNNFYGEMYYVSGRPANGLFSSKMYVDGKLADGLVGGKMYASGLVFTGERNGIRYSNGELFTGFFRDMNGSKLFTSGVLHSGLYNGLYYNLGVVATGVFENSYYRRGVPSTGKVNGLNYFKGPLANGVIDEICFVQGKVFSGIYASGEFQGLGCERGLVVPEILSLSAFKGRSDIPLNIIGRGLSSSSVKVLASSGEFRNQDISQHCNRSGSVFNCNLSSLVNKTSAIVVTFNLQNKSGTTSKGSTAFKLL